MSGAIAGEGADLKQPQTAHKRFIDVLTVLSCIAVVALHANGVFWAHPSGRLWVTSNIIETVFYYAVPVFFMISGYTLIGFRKRYGVGEFVKKRVKRTVIPFVAWSAIGCIFLWVYKGEWIRPSDFFLAMFNCKIMSIYWFFIPLFACYMAIPVLADVCDKRKTFAYMILLAFLSYSVLPFAEQFFRIQINHAIQFPVAGGYVMYLLLGYVFGNVEIEKRVRWGIYFAGIVGLFLHCYMTIRLSPAGSPISQMYKGYLNFPCVLYSVSIFVFCRYASWGWLYENKILNFLMKLVKDNSLGVYLIHGYFVYYIAPGIVDTKSILYRTFGALLIVLMCACISKLIKKMPLIRNIL